jgi:PKHD-type hydroxylase
MMLHIPRVLTRDEVGYCNEVLAKAAWIDGRATAGEQSGQVKRNLQVPEGSAEAETLGAIILKALAGNARFMSAALPLRVYPPLFNKYAEGMGFGDHIDSAVRISSVTGGRYRTDLSCTVFLTDPNQYDGGELIIPGNHSQTGVKLPAGDMVLYLASSVHRVERVTRGERWASFFWVQSMVADPTQRDILHDLDQAIIVARGDLGDAHPAAVSLVGVYHNLIRMWSQF